MNNTIRSVPEGQYEFSPAGTAGYADWPVRNPGGMNETASVQASLRDSICHAISSRQFLPG